MFADFMLNSCDVIETSSSSMNEISEIYFCIDVTDNIVNIVCCKKSFFIFIIWHGID